MKRRIFIAINLPDSVKKRLFDFEEKWEHLPARWVRKDSLHLTLVFIGYADDEETYAICKLVRKVAQEHEPFTMQFEKITYGPAEDKTPRMIWAKGKPSDEAARLKSELEEALLSLEEARSFRPERRPFSPHITLARIKMGQWHSLLETPKIEQDFHGSVPVESIEVMESELRKDGAEYVILESCPLKA